MASNDTEEQLKNLDKETIIRLFLAQKEQLENLDHTLQLVLEQLADLKRHRFGRSTERHETDGQILFMEIDGKIVFFNEAEAVAGKAGEKAAVKPPRRDSAESADDDDFGDILKMFRNK